MEAIANLVLAAVDLAEAEGRAAHRAVIRLLIRMGAIVVAGILGLCGIGLILQGIYRALVMAWGPVWASLISGGILVIVSAGLYFYGKRSPKPAQTSQAEVRLAPQTDEGGDDDSLHRNAA